MALTRAKRELYLLSAKRRMLWGKISIQEPSVFLDEIEDGLLSIIGEPSKRADSWGGWDEKPRARMGWGSGGGNLIQQGFGKDAKSFTMKTVHRPSASGTPLFPIGQRVYDDKYGEGEVISSRQRPDGEKVIEVNFFGGKRATYVEKFADLEKIES